MNTPVKVTFDMRTPLIAPTTRKHFDGILSWAAAQEADFTGVENPIERQHDIGIARHEVGDQWCFMASEVHFEWCGEPDQLHYIKRSRLEDYAGAWDAGLLKKKPYFDGARGSTKAGSYFQPLRWAKTVTAYAVVSDMKRFTALLPWVTSIGKLGHKDFGAVRQFEVIEDESANELWKARNLPIKSKFATGSPIAIGGLVSPYWSREKHVEIAVGGR